MNAFAVMNPATGKAVAEAPDNGPAEARAAASRAVSAFGAWKAMTAYERSAILEAWTAAILAHDDEIARLMAQEMGKPVTEGRGEARYAASFVKWYAEEAKRVYGEIIPSQAAHKRLLVRPQPVGPVYAITPWNFPAAMITRKAAPALAAGCTVVVKPAEQSPLTAIRLAELWVKIGGPAEVFQVLPTSDPAALSKVFFDDPAIRKLSFTGSTAVGIELAAQAARTVKRVSLELGGHAPFLVFDDADIDSAVREVAASKFRNAGQTCVCANRIYVHERVHDAFVSKFSALVAGLRVGDPMDDATQVGPLVDGQGLEKVRAHVDDARAKGAKAVVGGGVREGLYYEPTVLTGIGRGMRILEEETFGPVAPIIQFSAEEAAVGMANDTPFGLAAYIWTRDLARAFRVAESLDYGIVGVNDGLPSTAQAPFGGIKASGFGREGGKWGIEEYLDLKYISISLQ
jgi:succinate-semialdehyde dehydrogenase/glutarate-semialdehyde dehydrogenase